MTRVRLVVGAAVVRHGRVLAARRAPRDPLAGRWELPGGKLEPGETPEQALVREVTEELGCTVEVGAALPGEVSLEGDLVLRAYMCRLVGGEPEPREHDALRWVGPEELTNVAWVLADKGFVEALRERLLDGEELPGGNVGGAVRIGATVRRPTGPWTAAVHGLLRHLEGTGLPGVPRVLGLDARDREVLTYLPGRCHDPDDRTHPDDVLADAVGWLRRYHDTVSDYRPIGSVRWRGGDGALADDQIVCHNDCGSYNWVVYDGRFVGMIDWDLAGPGIPLDDVAFLAWSGVPLFGDVDPVEVGRRLRLVTGTYGGVSAVEVARHAVARMTASVERIAVGQSAGDPGMVALADIGEPARTLARVDALRARWPAVAAALR